MDLRQGIAGQVARTGKPVRLRDAYADPAFHAEIDRRTGYRTRSLLCLPVQGPDGRIIAVAQLLNKRGAEEFGETDAHGERRRGDPAGCVDNGVSQALVRTPVHD